jgi:rRNA metabolism SBDS family protein
MSIVRYKGLELLCHPNTVAKFRDGKLTLEKVLQTDNIFISVQKGTRAKECDIQNVFGSVTTKAALEVMLQEGSYQISAAERRELIATKKRAIVGYITQNYLDARNKLPIPYSRTEAAVEQTKVRIDENTANDRLIKQILKKFPVPLVPQRGLTGILRVPHAHLGKVQGLIRKVGVIASERYDSAGALYEVVINTGNTDDFLQELNQTTNNECNFTVQTTDL